MVLRQGLGVGLVGVVVGLWGAALTTRLMGSLLFEISPHDPMTFGTVACVLVAVSALATLVPAQRAAAIDALNTLRT